MKAKTLVTIVALAIAPLFSGCQLNNGQYKKEIPVYGPTDPNSNREVIGHYTNSGFSRGLTIDTYKQPKKEAETEYKQQQELSISQENTEK